MPTEYKLEQGMPMNADAERTVLGSIMIDPGLFYETASMGLEADHFYLDAHRRIYRRMNDLDGDGIPIDMLTLQEALTRKKELEAVGGMAYLSSLIDGVPERESIAAWIDIVKGKAMLRGVIVISQNAIAEAIEHSQEWDEVLSREETALLNLHSGEAGRDTVRLRDYYEATIHKWFEQADLPPGPAAIGLSYGNHRLDEYTTGMRLKEVTLLGGHTKDGKTSVAIAALLANLKAGIPCLYMSHEMDRDVVLARMMAQETSVPFEHIRDPRKLRSVDRAAIEAARTLLLDLPLFINDAPAMRIEKIVATSRLHARREAVQLIVVDFIQKVDGPGDKKNEIVSNISKRLTELAKAENVHVLELSQLTNPGGDKIKTKPNPRMFRESGDMAMDAHCVLAVWRPEENGFYTYEDEILVLLQRSGPGGVFVPVRYDKQRLNFLPRGDTAASNQSEFQDFHS